MFIFGKKEAAQESEDFQAGRIKVLGTGCAKCNELEKNVKAALEALKLEEPVIHVKHYKQIAAYGVVATPALVIDEKVVVSGRLLKKEDIMNLLRERGF